MSVTSLLIGVELITVLCLSQVYSISDSVIHIYIYIYIYSFFFRFVSHIGYYRIFIG